MKLLCSIVLLFLLLAVSCRPDEVPPVPPTSASKDIHIIEDIFEGVPIVLAGSEGRNLIVSYQRRLEDGTELSFRLTSLQLPIIMEDSSGTAWDIFGEAVSGPLLGQKLKPVRSYMGYWFAFGAFFPGTEIYQDERSVPVISPTPPSENWLLPIDEVFAGTSKDAIPSIDAPVFEEYRPREFLDEAFYLEGEDLVVGMKIGDLYFAYPHAILDWHEVVNDERDEAFYSLIYCPLTGTAMAWDRFIDGELTTFGVSGLLHNNNVIPYDRKTDSYWSQMRGDCVNGPLIGEGAQHLTVVETSWETWKSMFPTPVLLSRNTGTQRDYTDYPYGDYRSNHELLPYPVSYDDPRLNRKERVHGVIIDGKAKVYRLSDF